MLKDGEISLTPFQALMINKIMPKGFKLESKENMIKYVDTIKPPTKKNKSNVKRLSFFLCIP